MQYEQRPPSGLHVPELISAGLLGSLAGADRPPDVHPLLVGNPLRGVGEAIGGILPQAIGLKTAMQQLPVAQAKSQNELTEQNILGERLKTLLPGGRWTDTAPYVMQASGSNVG